MPPRSNPPLSDFFVTAVGDKNVIDRNHFSVTKNGCVIASSRH